MSLYSTFVLVNATSTSLLFAFIFWVGTRGGRLTVGNLMQSFLAFVPVVNTILLLLVVYFYFTDEVK